MELPTTATATKVPAADTDLSAVESGNLPGQPEAAEVSPVPPLLTVDELANTKYEDYLENRFARYGH